MFAIAAASETFNTGLKPLLAAAEDGRAPVVVPRCTRPPYFRPKFIARREPPWYQHPSKRSCLNFPKPKNERLAQAPVSASLVLLFSHFRANHPRPKRLAQKAHRIRLGRTDDGFSPAA